MRLLVLSKRRPQGRDLLNRPYGRFFYLPYHLARQGHQVVLLLLGYGSDPAEHRHQFGFDWYSESLLPLVPGLGPGRYIARARSLIERMAPDWLIGCSDAWYGILAQHLGRHYGVKTLIDAYDNYESYIPWAKPLHLMWRRACREASAVTAAGPGLLALMTQQRKSGSTAVVPMAADPGFKPMDRDRCRRQLGLPPDIPLVGYSGSLHRSRGVGVLFGAIRRLKTRVPEARFVFSGRRQTGIGIPGDIQDVVIELGYLPDGKMPVLVNAMDVAVVVNHASAFGDHSHPVKLCEAVQCGVPVVSTSVAGAAWMLREHPECLVTPGDAEELASRVRTALSWGRRRYSGFCGWEDSAGCLLELLSRPG